MSDVYHWREFFFKNSLENTLMLFARGVSWAGGFSWSGWTSAEGFGPKVDTLEYCEEHLHGLDATWLKILRFFDSFWLVGYTSYGESKVLFFWGAIGGFSVDFGGYSSEKMQLNINISSWVASCVKVPSVGLICNVLEISRSTYISGHQEWSRGKYLEKWTWLTCHNFATVVLVSKPFLIYEFLRSEFVPFISSASPPRCVCLVFPGSHVNGRIPNRGSYRNPSTDSWRWAKRGETAGGGK